jgi:hypothetical protein
MQLITVSSHTEQTLCATLKIGQTITANRKNYKQLKKKKNYLIFSQTGKTKRCNSRVMLRPKIHPKFYINIYFTRYEMFKVANIKLQRTEKTCIYCIHNLTYLIYKLFIMWLLIYKDVTAI